MELLKALNINTKETRSNSKKRKNQDLPAHQRSIEVSRADTDMQIITEDGGENFNSRTQHQGPKTEVHIYDEANL